jgi:hypothetical protein
MKKLFVVFLLASAGWAQVQLTLTPSVPGAGVYPGASVALNVSLTGSAGLNIAGLQWSLASPLGASTAFSGAASQAASKTVMCAMPAGTLICLSVGLNVNTISDGVVAQITVTIPANQPPGPLTQVLSATYAANAAGSNVPITAGPLVTLNVLSHCDLNGDGIVNNADLLIAISQIEGVTACTTANINQAPGGCTVMDAVRVAIAAQAGGVCLTGP